MHVQSCSSEVQLRSRADSLTQVSILPRSLKWVATFANLLRMWCSRSCSALAGIKRVGVGKTAWSLWARTITWALWWSVDHKMSYTRLVLLLYYIFTYACRLLHGAAVADTRLKLINVSENMWRYVKYVKVWKNISETYPVCANGGSYE